MTKRGSERKETEDKIHSASDMWIVHFLLSKAMSSVIFRFFKSLFVTFSQVIFGLLPLMHMFLIGHTPKIIPLTWPEYIIRMRPDKYIINWSTRLEVTVCSSHYLS